jgi:hypothetical protein
MPLPRFCPLALALALVLDLYTPPLPRFPIYLEVPPPPPLSTLDSSLLLFRNLKLFRHIMGQVRRGRASERENLMLSGRDASR